MVGYKYLYPCSSLAGVIFLGGETSMDRNVLVANSPGGKMSRSRSVQGQTGKMANRPEHSTLTLRIAALRIAAFWIIGRARSETVYAGMVYRHFFGRLEIIPPLLSGRLPYRYASVSLRYAVHEIWSVDCQENH